MGRLFLLMLILLTIASQYHVMNRVGVQLAALVRGLIG